MIPRSLRMVSACGVFGLAAILLMPTEGRAGFDVAPGYDLFQTVPTTYFPPLGALTGVPLGTYNFGGSVGLQNTGTADTIIQRTTAATGSVSTPGTSPLVVDALQLETASPTSFNGGPIGNYFVTLQSVRGGTASTGSITISFNAGGLSGTFSSSIDVFFDVRYGSLTGSIVYSGDDVLTSTNVPWSDVAPAGALAITGVNQYLSGVNGDTSEDFWPATPFSEVSGSTTDPNTIYHSVTYAVVVPEPASVLMLGMGTISLGLYGWRRRGRSAA
jgi:PEP-CTERM motif